MESLILKTRLLLAGLASLLLVACAAPAPPIAVSNIERSATSSVVRDLRPPREKNEERFSLLVTNDAYGITRIGDTPIKPPPLRLFQHRAFEKLGAQTAPISIDVHHFVVYRNLQSWGRRGALGAAFGGAVGAAIASGSATQRAAGGSTLLTPKTFASVGADEWKLALFNPAEDPGPIISYVVYIDAEIQGKRTVTKTIYPSLKDNINLAIPEAVEAAIAFHLSQY
jgi:hypothetical protein